jgi:N-acetylglucosaminyldiphosphoundecaprenol N-acetyl-beta-D-mannosaminyltransferase
MEKGINVLGVELQIQPVQEAMALMDKNLRQAGLYVIQYLTMDLLTRAEKEEELKKCINQIDLRLIGEKGLLDALENKERIREREVLGNEFMKAFLKRMAREQCPLFLICDDQKQIEKLEAYLNTCYRESRIVDTYSMENWFGDYDEIVNRINASGAEVVISNLESPFRETFVAHNRNKLSPSIWFGLGEKQVEEFSEHHRTSFLWELFRQNMFKRRVNKYKDK